MTLCDCLSVCLGFLLSERTSGVSPVIFIDYNIKWRAADVSLVILKIEISKSYLSNLEKNFDGVKSEFSRDKTLMVSDFWLKTVDSLGPKESESGRMRHSRFLKRDILSL